MDKLNEVKVKTIEIKLDNNLIVVGSVGAGKSTLVNMLFNDDISPDSCSSPAPVSFSAESCTKTTNFYFNAKLGISLMDTIGFGDHKLTECPICSNSMPFEEFCNTNCNHTFHVSCIQSQFQINTRCPICRTNVKELFKVKS